MAAARKLFGLWQVKPAGPDHKGTKAAFKAGEKVYKKSGGASDKLKRVVRMHYANTAPSR